MCCADSWGLAHKKCGRLQNSNMQRLTLPTELNWVTEFERELIIEEVK